MASASAQSALKQYVESLIKLVKRSRSKDTSSSNGRVEGGIQQRDQAQDLLQDRRFLQRTDEGDCPSAHLLLAFSLELVRSQKLRDSVESHLQQCEKCALYVRDLRSPIQHPETKEILSALKSKKARVIDVIEDHFKKP